MSDDQRPHPEYGQCDRMGVDKECSECTGIVHVTGRGEKIPSWQTGTTYGDRQRYFNLPSREKDRIITALKRGLNGHLSPDAHFPPTEREVVNANKALERLEQMLS